ncbi:MAG TPA: hypothetical protein VMH83_00675, partial [Candidatus Acidoferrum sp.]|nr:hypothetical protein [Candidatus Acidoferrum sp.]
STSGILPGLGAGIYTVSKMAAVALMEELRLELRNSNIGTTAFVPGLTTSNIGQSESYRPDSLKNLEIDSAGEIAPPTPPRAAAAGAAAARRAPPSADTTPYARRPHDPMVAGYLVLNGILNNDLYVVAQPEYRAGIEAKAMALLESMHPVKPLPDSMYGSNSFRCPIYVQEIAHRRATLKRDIKGI